MQASTLQASTLQAQVQKNITNNNLPHAICNCATMSYYQELRNMILLLPLTDNFESVHLQLNYADTLHVCMIYFGKTA